MNSNLRNSFALLLVWTAACKKGEGSSLPFQTVGRQPDIAPVMLNKELPFRYPPALYAQKVQGNVTLRIYIARDGSIVADSTRVAETSGFNALDSAAMKGSRDLKFEPAKTQGQAVPVSILLPVFFRHPDAPPLAGDSVINRDPSTDSIALKLADSIKAAADIAKSSSAKPTASKPAGGTTRRKTTR
jgi:TonB family protein